jgi:crossover junction endodeoxyribonuclease RusA
MLPFEFTVAGPPVSQQTRRRERLALWREVVRAAAQELWPSEGAPLEGELGLKITYFYEGAPSDVDNIVKPILDSIKALIYRDDVQITDLISRRRPLRGPFRIEEVSPILAAALDRGEEFLHVLITDPPAEGELLF